VTERILLGHVLVESGRVVVADPADVEAEWLREADLHRLHIWGPNAAELVMAMRSASDVAEARREGEHWILTPAEGQMVETLHERAEALSGEMGWETRLTYPYRTGAELAAEQGELGFLDGRAHLAVAAGAAEGLLPVYLVLEAGDPLRLEVGLRPD
jgi:glycine cleavage system aminomethyltransferase T